MAELNININSALNAAGIDQAIDKINQLKKSATDLNSTMKGMGQSGGAFSAQVKQANDLASAMNKVTTAANNMNKAMRAAPGASGAQGFATQAKQAQQAATQMQQAAQQMQAAQKTMMGTKTGKPQFGITPQQINTLKRQAAQTEAAIDKINDQYERFSQLSAKGTSAGSLSTTELRQFNSLATQLGKALGSSNPEIATYTKGLVQAGKASQQASSGMTRLATAARSIGNALSSVASYGMKLVNALRSVMSAAASAARTIGGALVGALQKASSAMGKTASGASRFATSMKSLSTAGGAARKFGSDVSAGMRQADTALNKTAAGWSTMMIGQQMYQGGETILRGIGNQLTNYAEYEKVAARAAIAAGLPDTQLIDAVVTGIQRGTYSGEAIKNFSRTDLADALYIYSSAIGQDITEQNAGALVSTMLPMLQASQSTLTDPSTMIKGVLNAAMEFGINARDLGEAGPAIQDTAKMFAYLANVSSMEVPDIIEFFKMTGPLAGLLSDKGGLDAMQEVMGFAFMASEMGLRGGQPGRGLAQLLQSLLDPTNPMQEAAEKWWGQDIQDTFFDDQGKLKGGIAGLFEPFIDMAEADWLKAQAELFTNNASRALIPIIEGARQDPDKWDGILEQLGSDKGMGFLDNAFKVMDQTVGGSMQNLVNAATTARDAVIASIDGIARAGQERFGITDIFNGLADVLFEVRDILTDFPEIGQFFAALAAGTGVILAVGGALASLVGTLLLAQRAFLLIGSGASAAMAAFSAIPTVLAIGIPILAALGVAAVGLKAAWESNFLGMRDAVESFMNDPQGGISNLSEVVAPTIANVIQSIQLGIEAFKQFVRGIMGGVGPTEAIAQVMKEILGTFMGAKAYEGILKIGEAFTGVREHLFDFADSAEQVFPKVLKGLGAGVGMFLEELLFGQSNSRHYGPLKALEDSLVGTDFERLIDPVANFSARIKVLADDVRAGIGIIINYFQELFATIGVGSANFGVLDEIAANVQSFVSQVQTALASLVEGGAVEQIKAFFTSMAAGFAQGFAASVQMILGVVEKLTSILSRLPGSFGQITTKMGGFTSTIKEMGVTIEGVGTAIGVALGVSLGTRLLSAFTPILGIMSRVGQATLMVSAHFVALGARAAAAVLGITIIAVQMGLYVAQATVAVGITLALAGAKMALAGATTAVSLAKGLATGTTMALSGAQIALAAATAAVSLAMAPLVIAVGLLAAALPLLAVGMLIAAANSEAFRSQLISLAQDLGPKLLEGLQGALDKIIEIMSNLADKIAELHADGTLQAWADGAASAAQTAGDAFGALADAIGTTVLLLGSLKDADVAANLGIIGTLQDIKNADLYVNSDFGKENPIDPIGGLINAYESVFNPLNETIAYPIDNRLTGYDTKRNDYMLAELVTGAGLGNDAYLLARHAVDEQQKDMWSGILDSVQDASTTYGPQVMDWLEKDLARVLGVKELDLSKISDEQWDVLMEMPGTDALLTSWGGDEKAWEKRLKLMTDNPEMFPGLADLLKPTAMSEDDNLYRGLVGSGFAAQEAAAEAGRAAAEAFNTAFDEGIKAIGAYENLQQAMDDQFLTTGASSNFLEALSSPGIMDAIANAIPEEARWWANPAEALMDVAGMDKGMFDMASQWGDMAGKNMHAAIINSKGMQRFAQETGMDLAAMVETIPKYMHDATFVPAATSMILGQIAEIPEAIYPNLDYFGKSQGWSDIGFEIQDLIEYSISQAAAGNDWNLTEFFLEEFKQNNPGITAEQINDALVGAGIDPNLITDATVEPIKAAMMTAGGELAAFSNDMWKTVQDSQIEGMGKMLAMTEEQVLALDPSIRQSLGAAGYSIVTGDGGWVDSILKATQGAAPAIMEGFQVVVDGVDADGMVQSHLVDPINGLEIPLPEVTTGAFLTSVKKARAEVLDIWTTPAEGEEFSPDEAARRDRVGAGNVADSVTGLDKIKGAEEYINSVLGFNPKDAAAQIPKAMEPVEAAAAQARQDVQNAFIGGDINSMGGPGERGEAGTGSSRTGYPILDAIAPPTSIIQSEMARVAQDTTDALTTAMGTAAGDSGDTQTATGPMAALGQTTAQQYANSFQSELQTLLPQAIQAAFGTTRSQSPDGQIYADTTGSMSQFMQMGQEGARQFIEGYQNTLAQGMTSAVGSALMGQGYIAPEDQVGGMAGRPDFAESGLGSKFTLLGQEAAQTFSTSFQTQMAQSMTTLFSGGMTTGTGTSQGGEQGGTTGGGFASQFIANFALQLGNADTTPITTAMQALLNRAIASGVSLGANSMGGPGERGEAGTASGAGSGVGASIVGMIAQQIGGASTAPITTAITTLLSQASVPISTTTNQWIVTFTTTFAAIGNVVVTGMATIVNNIISTMAFASQPISAYTNVWITTFSTTFSAMAGVVTSGMAVVTGAITSGMVAANAAVSTATNQMITTISTTGGAMTSTMSSAMSQVTNAITSGMASANQAVSVATNQIILTLASTAGVAKAMGERLGSGFAQGIDSQEGAVQAAANRLASIATSTLQTALQIASPSKVTTEIGEDFGGGFAGGITNTYGDIGMSADGAAQQAIQGVMDSLGIDWSGDAAAAMTGNMDGAISQMGEGMRSKLTGMGDKIRSELEGMRDRLWEKFFGGKPGGGNQQKGIAEQAIEIIRGGGTLGGNADEAPASPAADKEYRTEAKGEFSGGGTGYAHPGSTLMQKLGKNLGSSMGEGVTEGLNQSQQPVMDATSNLMDSAKSAGTSALGAADGCSTVTQDTIGKPAGCGIATGLESMKPNVDSALSNLTTGATDMASQTAGATDGCSTLTQEKIGAPMGCGVATGIESANIPTQEALRNNVMQSVNAALEAAGVKKGDSSTLTEDQVGAPLGKGVAEGISNEQPNVENAMGTTVKKSADGTTKTADKAGKEIGGELAGGVANEMAGAGEKISGSMEEMTKKIKDMVSQSIGQFGDMGHAAQDMASVVQNALDKAIGAGYNANLKNLDLTGGNLPHNPNANKWLGGGGPGSGAGGGGGGRRTRGSSVNDEAITSTSTGGSSMGAAGYGMTEDYATQMRNLRSGWRRERDKMHKKMRKERRYLSKNIRAADRREEAGTTYEVIDQLNTRFDLMEGGFLRDWEKGQIYAISENEKQANKLLKSLGLEGQLDAADAVKSVNQFDDDDAFGYQNYWSDLADEQATATSEKIKDWLEPAELTQIETMREGFLRSRIEYLKGAREIAKSFGGKTKEFDKAIETARGHIDQLNDRVQDIERKVHVTVRDINKLGNDDSGGGSGSSSDDDEADKKDKKKRGRGGAVRNHKKRSKKAQRRNQKDKKKDDGPDPTFGEESVSSQRAFDVASTSFAPASVSQPTIEGTGTLIINLHGDVNIAKEADLDALVAKVNRLVGKQMQIEMRGMGGGLDL